MKEAMLWRPGKEKNVKCYLCSHHCLIKPSKRGICGVRENQDGVLYSLVYGKTIAKHVDPIEKKPLYHFLPGSFSYSIATVGCNLKCLFCQNADISQMPRDYNKIMGEEFLPDEVVKQAKATRCRTIAYTYTEPTIFFEYAYETSLLASQDGLKNLFITNGYMTEDALEAIHPHLHAANVDLKAFNNEYYKKICGAKLKPVLESIRTMKKLGVWIEITTLLIPTLNDSESELKDLAQFILDVGPEVPWHISRFYPTYRLTDVAPTPVKSIRKAREIGLKVGLRYVYSGNVPGDEGENTFCYNCGHLLIQRVGYSIAKNEIADSKCPQCGSKIDGVGL